MNSTVSTASKRNEVMVGLSRASAIRWREMRAKGFQPASLFWETSRGFFPRSSVTGARVGFMSLEQEAGGSNPSAQTIFSITYGLFQGFLKFHCR